MLVTASVIHRSSEHMHITRLVVLFLLLVLPGMSQGFRVGVKGGVPFTDVVQSEGLRASSPNYVVGPAVELRLPFGLGMEADALYRRVRGPDGDTSSAWEFPIVAKYRMGGGPAQPFALGGLSFNRNEVLRVFQDGSDVASGWVAGLGLEFGVPVIHFTTEGRYTRWFSDIRSQGLGLDNRNQFEILLGITF